MEIRKICPKDDRLEISNVYEKSWKYAYKGIIPKDYLDNIPIGRWATNIDKPGMNTLIMIESGNIIGTSSYCKSRFPNLSDSGEIVSIYLLPQYIKKGLGILLFEAVVNELKASGFQDIFLWVLEENTHARQFYEKYGFYFNNDYLDDNIGGKDLRELCYRYHID